MAPSLQTHFRRRQGVAIGVAFVVALALAWTRPWTSEVPAAVGSGTQAASPGGSAVPRAAASADPVPAWLAWMPGGFPEGFRGDAADAGFDTSVVVAGDTLWLSASRDRDGAVVDRPTPPFRIPIDAFAVEPSAYASFLPDAYRDQVIGALDRGRAVLGSTSGKLRRLGPGATLVFGGVTVRVGAVVPDEVIGWSEMLVSREVGAELGIEHDRYLLALDADLAVPRFESRVRRLLPPDTYLRVVAPGKTTYVRVASGVNPPVVMKEVFGEFAAAPRADDPAFFTMDPAWYDAHIVTQRVPILGQVTCNEAFMPALRDALREVVRRGLDRLISIYSGCYAPRTVARRTTAPPSQHAWGAAIDIDAPTNGYGDTTPAIDPRVVRVFDRHGFIWGGRFLIPDGMHFEYGEPDPST
jgi:hypothetical protein